VPSGDTKFSPAGETTATREVRRGGATHDKRPSVQIDGARRAGPAGYADDGNRGDGSAAAQQCGTATGPDLAPPPTDTATATATANGVTEKAADATDRFETPTITAKEFVQLKAHKVTEQARQLGNVSKERAVDRRETRVVDGNQVVRPANRKGKGGEATVRPALGELHKDIDPESYPDNLAKAFGQIGGHIRVGVGAAGELATLRMLESHGASPTDLNTLNLNFPMLDIVSAHGFDSVKAFQVGVNSSPSQRTLARYSRTLRNLTRKDTQINRNAAAHIHQNADRLQASWPEGLAKDATVDQIGDFISTNSRVLIPNDHVNAAREKAITDMQRRPEAWGFPEDRQALARRLIGCGATAAELNGEAERLFARIPSKSSVPTHQGG
jgi:hypothetical protein